MKHLKMLGLAAIAALGLMAFVGAGTASATTLATDAGGTLTYVPGVEIHSTLKSGTSSLLEKTNGEKIATCTGSTVKGSLGTATGTWVASNISTLTWEGCSQTTDNLANGSLEIMKSGADEAEVIGKGSNVTLGVFGVSCVYGTTAEGDKLGTIKGGEAPELAINALLPKTGGGFLCPGAGIWTANYIVTSPHAVHIVE